VTISAATTGGTTLFSQVVPVTVQADTSNDVYVTGVANGFSGSAVLSGKTVCGKRSIVIRAALYFL
jgi:hypothetical protein